MQLKAIWLLGVACLWVVTSCEENGAEGEELTEAANNLKIGRIEKPEVVLSVKYDNGAVNGIYLAQYRKTLIGEVISVPQRTQMCQDLCYAGLGGNACGESCHNLIPVGLLELSHGTSASNETNLADLKGQPRNNVCPILCENNLGYPLCACSTSDKLEYLPDWQGVCDVFCSTDKYTLRGCQECDPTRLTSSSSILHESTRYMAGSSRVLETYDGWIAWCGIQCRQGEGGAACNCDRAPFS